MTQEKFNQLVESELDRIRNILIKKDTEYNLSNDPLSHFKHACKFADWTPEKVLYGYMLKHLVSITDMVNSEKKYTKAQWQEKMTDIHDYLILLLGLLEDDNMFLNEKNSENN